MPELLVRELETRDLQPIVRMVRGLFAKEDAAYGTSDEMLKRAFGQYRLSRYVRRLTGRIEDKFLVGEVAGEPVATAAINRVSDAWYVSAVTVHADHQGKGYGRTLLQSACFEIQKQGGKRAILHVRSDNEAAKKLYESAGFRIFERQLSYMRNVHDVLAVDEMPTPYAMKNIGRFDKRGFSTVDLCRESNSSAIYGVTLRPHLTRRVLRRLNFGIKAEKSAITFAQEWVGLYAFFAAAKAEAGEVELYLMRGHRGKLEKHLLEFGMNRSRELGKTRIVVPFDSRHVELEASCKELGFELAFQTDGMVKDIS